MDTFRTPFFFLSRQVEAVDDGWMRIVLYSKQQREKNPTSRIPDVWSFITILNRREDTGDKTAWPAFKA